MAKCLTQIRNESSNDRLRLVCDLMVRQYGGVQGFVAAWIEYQQKALDQGGFAAFRCLHTVLRLMQYCEETEPDPAEMTDEELERVLMEQAIRLIRARPELAVSAASQIGWTVNPPDDGESKSVGANAENPQPSQC